MKKIQFILPLVALISLGGCGSVSRILNPYYEPPSQVALYGQANDHALNGSQGKTDSAREALEQMSTYQRAHAPQPVNPVIQPAVVRLMWIPDHLNGHGDLVPGHFYYLKVLKDRWAVTDTFELESQLSGDSHSTSVPFVYDGPRNQAPTN